jgi:hypothetical protein
VGDSLSLKERQRFETGRNVNGFSDPHRRAFEGPRIVALLLY